MSENSFKKLYNNDSEVLTSESLFKNLPDVIRASEAARLLGVSVKTIYDWHYRGKMRNVPEKLFVKINRLLFLKTNELRKWIALQN